MLICHIVDQAVDAGFCLWIFSPEFVRYLQLSGCEWIAIVGQASLSLISLPLELCKVEGFSGRLILNVALV